MQVVPGGTRTSEYGMPQLLPANLPPNVTPDGGQRGITPAPGRIFMQQFSFTDDLDSALNWSVVSFTGPQPTSNYSIDGTGKFSWDTTGVPAGYQQVYHLVVRGTDNGPGPGLSNDGDIFITMPEPGTFVLAGMSLIALVTSRRKLV